MRIMAQAVLAQNLEPGDLFSTVGSDYWERCDERGAIGERVYIRTNAPTPDDQRDMKIYRVSIVEETDG